MTQPFKDAASICKTIMRNGYDAYIINARLQHLSLDQGNEHTIDICTDLDYHRLLRYFPSVQQSREESVTAYLKQGAATYYFYPANVDEASHPEETVARITPRLLDRLSDSGELTYAMASPYIPKVRDVYEGLADLAEGRIRFKGIPDQTLKKDYLLAVRSLRFAANYHLPVEPNTWVAIVRGARRVLDYVAPTDIMDEWRKVESENMWYFVRLMFDCQLLHGLMPEIAALSRVKQMKSPEAGEENVLDHTFEVMRRYPEELPYDWYGTLACLFHDVGKLYTAEFFQGSWTFYQHHHVGAKITRKILTRLSFPLEDIDLICLLVRNHMRLHFMLTDKGIRKFKALDEYPRLIEMVRADLKARGGSYREFNHNMKMLERTETPMESLEPFLNGNQIMQCTGLKPGPTVGMIRETLLKAQIAGEVTGVEEAMAFVRDYVEREKIS
jgi:poly(A) polymerase